MGRSLSITSEVKRILCDYPWPGNIAELEPGLGPVDVERLDQRRVTKLNIYLKADYVDLPNEEQLLNSLFLEGKMRIAGIDTPEIKQTCEIEQGKSIDCGFLTKDYLQKLLENEPGDLIIKCLMLVRPSITGMSMSKVITSGRNLRTFSKQSFPFLAVPTTRMPASFSKI
jgi:hypothetical protein